MKTIYKYELSVEDEQIIEMPYLHQILSLQVQYGKPCIWVLVDLSVSTMENVKFVTYGTGHQVKPEIDKYVGTYQLNDGLLVFHVFKQS